MRKKMSTELFDLSGKVAIVTGTSRGLGQFFGRALANAGADLVITSRSLESLDAFKKEIEYLTGQTKLVDGGITTGSIRALPAQKNERKRT
jgi:short-subunit dehydrogenase